MWPTLDQVLSRRTEQPLCLYNFYIVMRDRLDAANILDFYLDVRHHQVLWRKLVKTMTRGEKDFEKEGADPSLYTIPTSSTNTFSTINTTRSSIAPKSRSKRHKHKHRSLQHHDSLTESIASSADRIVKKYIVADAPKQLHLPDKLNDLILQRISEERIDPAVFAEAQELCLTMMEHSAYPVFIREKAQANITGRQRHLRAIITILTLFIAFSVALSFIFLGYSTWSTRLWLLLPFWCATYNGLVYTTRIDPIWALFFNVSETTLFRFNIIMDSVVRRYLCKRSVFLLLGSAILAIALTAIFSAIPPRVI